MKTKYLIIPFFALSMSSCDYLDYSESSGYEKEDMFAYFDRAKGMLTTVYSYLPVDFGSTFGGSTRAGATDEGEYVWNAALIHRYNNGSWSPILTIDDVWSSYYKAIHTANLFLENYQAEFPDIMWNENYEQLMQQNKYYPYEARFLRAFFYFELIKRYKNVPLLERTYAMDEVNGIAPTDFEKVVEFIVKECNEIADMLPVTYKNVAGAETGRITQGAAMALKSRVLLYAASPLFNAAQEQSKWMEAAKAAKALIDKAQDEGWYELVAGEQAVNNLASKELILETRQGDSNFFEATNFPMGFEGGKSGLNPSQNLVDAFEMRDGSTFDWNNPTHVANMYNPEMRDSRLFKTIITNGSLWKGIIVETFVGGKNAPADGGTKTGYYLKKYLVEGISLDLNNTTSARHVWVLFRYAEILLNYAEALYAAYGNPDYTDATFTLSPRAAINKVRTRAGMPDAPADHFGERIRNERRVELAFEDHRFWDVRRWKMADKTMDIYGVKIEKEGDHLTYTHQLVDRRVWDEKMYLYPIANSEIFKNGALKQNTGW